MKKVYSELSMIPIDVKPEAQILAGTPTDAPQKPEITVDPYSNDQPGSFDPFNFD